MKGKDCLTWHQSQWKEPHFQSYHKQRGALYPNALMSCEGDTNVHSVTQEVSNERNLLGHRVKSPTIAGTSLNPVHKLVTLP